MLVNKIGLLGGMFDPVHNGHLTIASSFLQGGLIQELWVLPAYKPPHKNAEETTSFSHRFEMLNLAFDGQSKVKVLNVERFLPSPGYTVQTLAHLQKEYPNFTFYWCIGSDNLNSFTTWFRYEQILSEWMLLVAKRPDYETDKVPFEIRSRCIFVPHKPTDISSSSIRNSFNNNDISKEIPASVQKYIKRHNLYR
jgi:nicotinate-nucleotide adenylyltransferase